MKSDLLNEVGLSTAKHLQPLLSYWDTDFNCQYGNRHFWKHFNQTTERNDAPPSAKEIFPLSHYNEMLPHFELAYGRQEVLVGKSIEFSDGRTSELFISLIPDLFKGKVIGIFYQANEISIFESGLHTRQDIQKSQRLYEFISQVNELILRSKTGNEIYEQICEIAVSSGNFVHAWLGAEEEHNKLIKSLSWAGSQDLFLEVNTVIANEKKMGIGPIWSTLQEGKYFCCNNIDTHSEMFIWKPYSMKYGYKSCLALPFKQDGKTVALFKLFAPTINFFTEAEINLLARLAENISFALNTFSIEQKRIQAEQELKKVKQAIEQAGAAVVITDTKGNIEYINPAFTALTGYSYEDVIGANSNILKTADTSDAEYKAICEDLLKNKVWNGEFLNKRKNGDLYWEKVNISQVYNTAGEITHFISVKEEITRQKELEAEQQRMNEELHSFSWHLKHISEIEKNKLAIEMHDELGQGLIALKMEVAQLKKHLFEGPFVLETRVDNLLHSINEKVEAFTRIYNTVNPTILKALGLEATLENLLHSFKEKSAISFKFIYELQGLQIDYNTNLALYRIIKEGLTNIVNDSAATDATVSLQQIDHSILLNITDNGKGFEPAAVDGDYHFGILGMRETAYAISGSFEIHSTIGQGATITAKLPLPMQG